MNPEEKQVGQRETPERLPSQEEIRSAFETILGDKKYEQLRLQSDSQGVRLYEIEVVLEDGEKLEYNYQRATYDYKEKSLPAASIHVTWADGGQCVANYRDGTWQYVPQAI